MRTRSLVYSILPCILTISLLLGFVSPAVAIYADPIVLAKPGNACWADGSTATATWDPVENANYYEVSVNAYSSDTLIGSKDTGTADCSIDVQDIIRAIDGVTDYQSVNVTFKVCAVYKEDGAEDISSDWTSESDSMVYSLTAVNKYDTPTGLSFVLEEEGPVVRFDEVAGATRYDIDFYDAATDQCVAGEVIYYYGGDDILTGYDSTATVSDGRIEAVVSNALAKSFYNMPDYYNQEVELYCVVKVASQDQSNYIDSDYTEPSAIVKYTYSAAKYDTPTGLSFVLEEEGPVVRFDEVAGATRYDIDFYDAATDQCVAGEVIYYYGGDDILTGYDSTATVSDGRIEAVVSNALAKSFYNMPDYYNQEVELYCVVKVASQDQSNYIDSDYTEPSGTISYKYQLATTVESITISPANPFVSIGGAYSLGKTIEPADAYYESIDWTSSDDSVVTVDSLGKITGVAAGTATVTAAIGDVSSSVDVTVYALETNIDEASQEEVFNAANKVINGITEGDATGTDVADADAAAALIAAGMQNEYAFHVDMNQEESAQDYSTSGWNEIEALYSDDDFEPTYADALDVSIELYYEDSVGETTTIGNITEFDSDIQFEIEIPENLPEIEDGYTRDYSVVRVHEGEYEVLECTVNADDTITVESDKFSDFVLLYSDSPDGAETGVEINETNFPDEVFRQYVLDNIDKDGDLYLSEAEINSVSTIVINSSGVQSLVGIEYFSALTYLGCSSNSLSELDVSQNIHLEYLFCDNNQLSALDVSNNTNLEYLCCNHNQLSELVISSKIDDLWRQSYVQVRDDCEFGGWYIDEACTTRYSFGSSVTEPTILYGYWYCNVAFVTPNGTEYQAVKYGSTITIPEWISDTEYKLFTNEDCTIEFDIEEPIICPTNLYVVFEVAIDESNFPDEIFRQYVSDNFDTDSNGYLSNYETSGVTFINLYSCGVSSVEGIEWFKDLQTLECSSNNLTEIDLSQNPNLWDLRVDDNQLTELDVSDYSNLNCLYCCNNQLTELDVSKNSNLTTLGCWSNQLTSLQLNDNIATLYCNDNSLTELNVAGNESLERLGCDNNQIAELDVSGCFSLEYLSCGDNPITELDLADNDNLNNLYCDNNQLTELDLSNCTKLYELNCSHNQLEELDVSNNSCLSKLYCDSNLLTELNVTNNADLTVLDCHSNSLTELDVSNNISLDTLICSDNNLTGLDVSENSLLEYLWCASNKLTELDVSDCTGLLDLDCRDNELVRLITSVSLTPYEGYRQSSSNGTFAGWFAEDTFENEFDFTSEITSKTIIYAKWVMVGDYVITVSDTTGGTVTTSRQLADYEDQIEITANAATGYMLDKITVNGEEIIGTTFVMPAEDVTVEVTFKKVDYTITVNAGTGGTASADQTGANYGDQITVTATADAGYTLDKITVNGEEITGTTFEMPAADVTVEVTFKKVDYTITVSDVTGGTVTASKTAANYGDEIIITVEPEAGYKLGAISVDGTVITGTSFTMPAKNATVEVTFNKINYTVSVNNPDNGTVSVSPATATVGDEIIVSATPDAGYMVDTIKVNGTSIAGTTFTMPAEDATVEVSFKQIQLIVTFNANGHGTAPSAQTVNYGGKASKPADPTATGYTFGGWYTDSACTKAYNFNTAVTANVSLYAKWTVASTPTPTPTATPTPVPTAAPISTPTPTPEPVSSSELLVGGGAHVQDIGDTGVTVDPDTGILTIGTTGMGKRLEEILIDFENNTGYEGTMMYRVHVQDIGWMDWVEAGQKAGTEGMSKRIEAIEIVLTGELADYYSVEYCVHIQDYGDMQGWVHDGALAGTTGESKRIEEIKVRIVPKDSSETMSVMYRVHVQDYGWEKSYSSNGQMAGTSGESKRLEGIEIYLSGCQYSGGIKYKTHVQNIGWESSWAKDGEMSGTQGMSYRLEGICIELYGEVAEYYDIYYRVHAQDIGWMGWAKNGECAGTAARSARLEGIQIVLVPKGAPAPGATYEGITSVTGAAFVEGF